ncbi:hypothetical protein [Streptomyces sp. TLI_105]|uniref:hypothetical protein n=1 Tax=Streptomyces sp. TLI_105 TaxID=1881019 RepID=UPI00089CF03D|nr:hypothetical protein [Streptomyces sp. TLI_105]SED71082.1 hypothetical protein SAMN05428939_5980 [Streptomyces sp. TLI_105]
MTTPPTRALLRASLATLALSAVTLGGAPAAFAAPGDNGDVKVHRQGTPDTSQTNEPQVGCIFRFAGFNFDGLQSIQWSIAPQPNQPGNQLYPSGSIVLDANGDGATDDISGVPTGMYKVEWTWEGKNGSPKSKVFRVNCPDGGNGGNGNGGNGNGGNGNGGNGNGGNGGGHGHGRPPHGPVGAGGGGSAQLAAEDSSAFGVGAAVAAGLAGTAGLVLIRRSRRRDNGAA